MSQRETAQDDGSVGTLGSLSDTVFEGG